MRTKSLRHNPFILILFEKLRLFPSVGIGILKSNKYKPLQSVSLRIFPSHQAIIT